MKQLFITTAFLLIIWFVTLPVKAQHVAQAEQATATRVEQPAPVTVTPKQDPLKRPALKQKKSTRPQSSPPKKGASKARGSLPPDVLKGVQTVRVSAESSTIKVGLARLGQVAIEFPSADRVYKVSPAPEEFVKTNQKVFTRNDPVILYPGTGFVVPKGKLADPATILTVQMFSGLIVSVHVYPVESLAENATRIFVNYDKAVVVSARRSVGLPVNFDQIIEAEDSERKGKAQKAATAAAAVAANENDVQTIETKTLNVADELADGSQSTPGRVVGSEESATSSTSDSQGQNITPQTAASYLLAASTQNRRGSLNSGPPLDGGARPLKAKDVEREFFSRVAQSELSGTIKLGHKGLTKFTSPKYGLSVAVSRSKEVDSRRRSVVIAVRNVLREPVRLVPDQPDLAVVTLDSERPTDSAPIALVHRETTLKDNRLLPGEIGYFSVIFETPILGVQQILSARVAQMFAADAPASLDLAITAR